jgi:hypothetical protein
VEPNPQGFRTLLSDLNPELEVLDPEPELEFKLNKNRKKMNNLVVKIPVSLNLSDPTKDKKSDAVPT